MNLFRKAICKAKVLYQVASDAKRGYRPRYRRGGDTPGTVERLQSYDNVHTNIISAVETLINTREKYSQKYNGIYRNIHIVKFTNWLCIE